MTTPNSVTDLRTYVGKAHQLRDLKQGEPGKFSAIEAATPKACANSFADCVRTVCQHGIKDGFSSQQYNDLGRTISEKFAPHLGLPIGTLRYWIVESTRDLICKDPPPPNEATTRQISESDLAKLRALHSEHRADTEKIPSFEIPSAGGSCQGNRMVPGLAEKLGAFGAALLAFASIALVRANPLSGFGLFTAPPDNSEPKVI